MATAGAQSTKAAGKRNVVVRDRADAGGQRRSPNRRSHPATASASSSASSKCMGDAKAGVGAVGRREKQRRPGNPPRAAAQPRGRVGAQHVGHRAVLAQGRAWDRLPAGLSSTLSCCNPLASGSARSNGCHPAHIANASHAPPSPGSISSMRRRRRVGAQHRAADRAAGRRSAVLVAPCASASPIARDSAARLRCSGADLSGGRSDLPPLLAPGVRRNRPSCVGRPRRRPAALPRRPGRRTRRSGRRPCTPP